MPLLRDVPISTVQPSAKSELQAKSLPPLRVSYEHARVAQVLAQPDVLAVLGFDAGGVAVDDARFVRIGLSPIGDAPLEVWRTSAPKRSGFDGDVRWASDGSYLFFAIEVDEQAAGGLDLAAERAYRDIAGLLSRQHLAGGVRAQVLRLWNYLDAINDGIGDEERYRQFCSGRARGIGDMAGTGFSAATAIGRRDGVRVLQVYGLAARIAGIAVENPRQLSAWRYPREYGPTAPTFARATRTAADQLLVSGTAAVVGHASQHVGDTLAQIDETLINLDHLFEAAGAECAQGGASTMLLKAYVRDTGDAAVVDACIRARHPALGGLLLLAGDICRRELRVEVDGIQG